MKKLLPLIAIVLLHLGACKKDSGTTPTAESGWTLAGVSYKGTITVRTTTSGATPTTLVNFWDAVPSATLKVNSLALSFIQVPTASGTYQLVGVGAAKTASQFELSVGTTAPLYYAYIGTSVDIAVTVTGGKIKVVIPEITLKCTTSSPDAKFSASVQEM